MRSRVWSYIMNTEIMFIVGFAGQVIRSVAQADNRNIQHVEKPFDTKYLPSKQQANALERLVEMQA